MNAKVETRAWDSSDPEKEILILGTESWLKQRSWKRLSWTFTSFNGLAQLGIALENGQFEVDFKKTFFCDTQLLKEVL